MYLLLETNTMCKYACACLHILTRNALLPSFNVIPTSVSMMHHVVTMLIAIALDTNFIDNFQTFFFLK